MGKLRHAESGRSDWPQAKERFSGTLKMRTQKSQLPPSPAVTTKPHSPPRAGASANCPASPPPRMPMLEQAGRAPVRGSRSRRAAGLRNPFDSKTGTDANQTASRLGPQGGAGGCGVPSQPRRDRAGVKMAPVPLAELWREGAETT
ncbi:unnamed protein product [Eretmochelys imbricata]